MVDSIGGEIGGHSLSDQKELENDSVESRSEYVFTNGAVYKG